MMVYICRLTEKKTILSGIVRIQYEGLREREKMNFEKLTSELWKRKIKLEEIKNKRVSVIV